MANKPTDEQPIVLDASDVELQLERQARYLDSQSLATSARRAINRAARTARTHLSRGIRKRYALKAGDVKDEMEMERATDSKLHADIKVNTSPLPLKLYGAKQRKKGVSVRVTKSRGRTIIPGHFQLGMLGDQVFVRESGANRLPIIMQHGPAVGSAAERAWPEAEQKASQTLGSRLEHEVNRMVERANR